MPRVTVAIPTYNRLRYLRPCLESLKKQTYRNINLYIFDDGSTEPIEAEARKLFGDNLNFISSKENVGASANIQRILDFKFESDYLMIFHDDDVMHPRLIAEEVGLLETNPEASFVACKVRFYESEGEMSDFGPEAYAPIKYKIFLNEQDLARAFIEGIYLGFNSVLYRYSVLEKSNRHLEFETYGPNIDRPFLVNLTKNHPCIFIENRLVNYRIHGFQDSKNNQQNSIDMMIKLFHFYEKQLPIPLKKSDRRLLMRAGTKAMLANCYNSNQSIGECLKRIARLKSEGLFSLLELDHVGMRAIFSKILRTFIVKKKI